MTDPTNVLRHYGHSDILAKLEAALIASGLGESRLSPADLAPLDQFHTRGMAATIEFGAALGIEPGAHGIDIGSGLGGPSRYLASSLAVTCKVSISVMPSSRPQLIWRSVPGSTTTLPTIALTRWRCPMTASEFDFAWTQHVAMNIADRPRLYSEVYRVLKPGGQFAAYDVVAGAGGEPHFPVPWSRTPETSFLVTSGAMRAALEQAGFGVVTWEDRTQAGVDWFAEQQEARAAAQATGRGANVPPLGLHVVMGQDFSALSANLGRNLREGRVGIVQAVLQRR